MLCSFYFPNSSSTSSTTTTTTWLDRLHSSLGHSLPPPDLTLDHYLASPLPTPSPPPPITIPHPHLHPHPLSAALSDLFNFGYHPQDPPRDRKAVRKQRSPSCCAESRRRDPNVLSLGSAVGVSKRRAGKKRPDRKGKAVREEGEGRFSRTDVVVIDTSGADWKTAKVLLRKGTVWRVRDKKLWSLKRRRRRLGSAGKKAGSDVDGKPLDLPAGDKEDGKQNSSENCIEEPRLVSEKRLKFSRTPRRPTAKET